MEFITDRTQADVDRIKYVTKRLRELLIEENNGDHTHDDERTALLSEFMQNSKGALNYSDLHRITSNAIEICELLHITPPQFTEYSDAYDDRNTQEIPRHHDFPMQISVAMYLIRTIYRYASTPALPKYPYNTYQKINDIEQILKDAYTIHISNRDGEARCGDSAVTSSVFELFADENGEYMLL